MREIGDDPPYSETSILTSPDGAVITSQFDRKLGNSFGLRLTSVCVSCNGGWMSRLETAARPILLPLLRGEEWFIPSDSQQVLALWCTKTALAWDAFLRERIITAAQGTRILHDTQLPPPGTKVYIGACEKVTAIGAYRGRREISGPLREGAAGENAIVTTTTFNHFMFQVLSPGRYIPGGINDHTVPLEPTDLALIWPLTLGVVPPRRLFYRVEAFNAIARIPYGYPDGT